VSQLTSLSTVVLVTDWRVVSLAQTYALAVGSEAQYIPGLDSLTTAVSTARSLSVTLVLLNDAFDEKVVHAIARGNAVRVRSGQPPLTVGVMTAFDAPKLAWLFAKTLACLDMVAPSDALMGRFDGARGDTMWRLLGVDATATAASEPWTDPRTLAQSVVAHGVAFDLALGDVVLCSHLDPPLPAGRKVVAPSCFNDGICFRLARADGPKVQRRAADATPLVWGIDSCGAIAFQDNAFGDGSSYALALLAGSAVSVIGPYLPVSASGLAARAFEALIENGWSTGEIAAAMSCVDDNTIGFDPYLVLGSPDLRIVIPHGRTLERADGPLIRVDFGGRDTTAVELPPGDAGLYDVIADDGNAEWSGALARRVDAPSRAALLIAMNGSSSLVGSLTLGDERNARVALAKRLDTLNLCLGVLCGYKFAAEAIPLAESIREMARDAARILRAVYALRSVSVANLLWESICRALNVLEDQIALCFRDAVLKHDFSFDGESENGFVPGPLRRSADRCHICSAALFVAVDTWAANKRCRRHKATCPNCFGVTMRLVDSPLLPVALATKTTGTEFRVQVKLFSRADHPLRALLVGARRRGQADDAVGPIAVTIPARGEIDVDLPFRRTTCGVATYRLLVLSQGASAFYTAVDPGGNRSASSSLKTDTVAGSTPGPGHGRPATLNQTG
jgi:hypothetical protein